MKTKKTPNKTKMTIKKVVISGTFFDKDLKYVKGGLLLVKNFPPIRDILHSKNKEKSLFNSCKDADMVIFYMQGNSPQILDRLKQIADKIKIKKVFWSQDSHHLSDFELKIASKFDKLFIAHSPYLDKFKDFPAYWMPLSFVISIDDLKKIIVNKIFLQSPNKMLDVVFPHRPYDIGDRKKLNNIIKNKLQNKLRFFSGPVSVKKYKDVLLWSKVILNISLFNDLNLRNFEAWALNKVLLTNKVPDHDKIKGIDLSHTYFFLRDLSDFDQALDSALKDKGEINTSQYILNKHTIIYRYIDIINKTLKTNYKVCI